MTDKVVVNQSGTHESGGGGYGSDYRGGGGGGGGYDGDYGRGYGQGSPRSGRRLSWGAIFAGFFVAIGVHLLLALLGIAIGLSTFSPASPGGPSAGDIATGVGAWAAISALIALFVGGATTGHLAGWLRPGDGFLHGAILWSLVTVAIVWLMVGGMGFLMGGAFGVIGKTASATINVAGQAATEVAPAMISLADEDRRREMAAEIAQRAGISAGDAQEIVARAEERVQEAGAAVSDRADSLQERVASGDVLTQEQRTALMTAIGQRTGIDADSARAIVTHAEERAQEARSRVAAGVQNAEQQLNETRQALAADIAQRTGLSTEATTTMVAAVVVTGGNVRENVAARVDSGMSAVRQTALEGAESAVHSTAKGAWWTLLALGLSLGAAGAGATITARR